MSSLEYLKNNLKAGQTITKQSFPKWYEIHLKILYWAIKAYQKKKWRKNYKAVHVYVVLPAPEKLFFENAILISENTFESGYVAKGTLVLFEQTWPVSKWTHLNYLHDKTFAVNHCDKELAVFQMLDEAQEWIGKKYDIGDLVDFAISGLILGIYKRVYRFVGDKARRFGVCSTVAAKVLNAGGCDIDEPGATSPAYYEGNYPAWQVKHRFEWGKQLI